MGPKKGKDIDEDNYWRTRIEEAPLDEENWRVQVMLFESAGSDDDRIYLSKFETFAAEERRFVIKNICKTETIFMINQLGGEKKVKDDNLRVFEEGQAFLKDKKDVPPEVLALIIKHLILKIKEEYMFIKRQKLEVNEGMRRESTTMINKAEVRGTVSVKPPVPIEPVTPLPKGKGKKEDLKIVDIPEPLEGKKYNTSLRVRGEEWRDKIYVDDFPTDGPNIYVAVTGFVEPLLPQWLVKIGVPLTAIVQIRIDPCISKVPSGLLRPTKRGYSQTEFLTEKCQKFWEDLQQLRMEKNTADDFKHTAFIVFSPPYSDEESLSANPDKIYDELCFLMYDVQDLTRQHLQYLDNLDIINIPCETNDTRYVQHYKKQINHLPLECVTIYSVLDSILRTVSLGSELDEESSRSSSSMNTVNEPFKGLNVDKKVEKAEKYVKNVFEILCKTDGAKKAYRITYGDECENQKDPIVINHGDFVKNNTFHLGNINLDSIVWYSLLGMPINGLWKKQKRPEGELEAKINFHVNVLLSCFDRQDVETSELNRLIHILACRKLYNNRSSTKQKPVPSSTILDFKKKYLKRSVLAEPMLKGPPIKIYSSNMITSSCASITKSENMSNIGLIEPSNDRVDFETKQVRFLFDCPDISELVSAAEIANGKPLDHLIDDFEFFEDFTDIRAFQVLLDVYNKFNCVDYKYCEVTDCFLLMFYNSHDLEGIIREEWRGHLPTPICLQDFFDFVLEEHYDWIQNEERIYDENAIKKAQSQFKDFIDPHALKSCIEDTVVEVDLLMEGSLKYKERTEIEQLSPNPSIETKLDTSKKNTLSPTSTEPTSGSSKRTKSAPVTTPKTLRKDFMASGAPSQISLEVPMKQFLGYDLDDRRVEVFGKDATYFSKDGTRVSSKYTLLIPINSEFVTLNYSPGNMDNEIWVHKASGELIATNMLDVCESFRIKTKDQVLININKQVYQIPIPCETTKPKKIESITLSKKISKFSPQVFESKYFHSLFLTWPNGLITETVYENNSPILSHIKQYYKSSVSNVDEDMRCISLNGEVIIFKTSGNIEVLRPDGSYITINKYEKRRVNEISEELVLSENDSTKTKKSKTKIQKQAKDSKGSRVTSKSSRIKNDEYDKISDDLEKPIEYELVIKEFEIVEANGLRQKWILDECFDIERLLIRTATDYSLGEVFSRRIDGVHILLNKDGTQVVGFPNGTRIITKYVIEDQDIFPEWTEAEKEYFDIVDSIDIDHDIKSTKSMTQKSSVETFKTGSSNSKNLEEKEINEKDKEDGYLSVRLIYTVEHSNFTTVTIDQMTGKISIDSPNNTTVIIDSNNHYNLVLDNLTIANFDGENLRVDYEACSHCKTHTSCNIKIISDEMSSITKNNRSWLKMKDSFGKNIIVDEEGNITSVEEPCSTEMLNAEDTTYPEHCESPVCTENKTCDVVSETSGTSSHVKCREKKLANAIRFFVLGRNLNCSELVHRLLLDQYKRDCQWQPWCNISQYDTFGDHRSLISILTPVHLTETEKWLMDSKLADKPKYLTYKDLKKDNGKGFYHWMRPYERFKPTPVKIDNVLPTRLPRAFILRILEQQWNESQRDELKGAKELLKAILKYRQIMETDIETILHVPVLDLRPQDERRVDEIIQALAHRIYEDLRTRLADDVQTRVKPTITTKPTIAPEEMSVMGEFEEENPDELKTLEKERGNMIKEVEVAEEMSPNLKRYWRRRGEEFKEEQFYMYLLREGSVPPYFQNVLGGAIWSQMNDAAEDAVTRAERRKMKCVCSTEEDVPRSSNATILM